MPGCAQDAVTREAACHSQCSRKQITVLVGWLVGWLVGPSGSLSISLLRKPTAIDQRSRGRYSMCVRCGEADPFGKR